jgi:hypothetical protein
MAIRRLAERTGSASQYYGYSLRRDDCSFDSTLPDAKRMTICSCRTQSSPLHKKRTLHFPLEKLSRRSRLNLTGQNWRVGRLRLESQRIPCRQATRFGCGSWSSRRDRSSPADRDSDRAHGPGGCRRGRVQRTASDRPAFEAGAACRRGPFDDQAALLCLLYPGGSVNRCRLRTSRRLVNGRGERIRTSDPLGPKSGM